MAKPAHDIYAEHMFKCGNGLALYEPNSFGNQDGTPYPVQIGDVGRVFRGMFCRLFNILYESYHPINNGRVPYDFNPLPWRRRFISTTLVPPIVYATTWRQTSFTVSASGPVFIEAGADVGVEFQTRNDSALIIKCPANRTDSTCETQLGEALLKNHRSWLEFANGDSFNWGIKCEELIMVTGCDLTTDWALMAVSRSFNHFSARFQSGIEGISSGGVEFWASWENATNVHSNRGPRHINNDEENGGAQPNIRTGEPNQCIFLRGYRVIRRITGKAPRRLRAAALAGPRDDSRPPEPSKQPCLSIDHCFSVDSDTELDQDGLEGPECGVTKLYVELANKMASAHPSLDVILVHDEDICEYLDQLPTVYTYNNDFYDRPSRDLARAPLDIFECHGQMVGRLYRGNQVIETPHTRTNSPQSQGFNLKRQELRPPMRVRTTAPSIDKGLKKNRMFDIDEGCLRGYYPDRRLSNVDRSLTGTTPINGGSGAITGGSTSNVVGSHRATIDDGDDGDETVGNSSVVIGGSKTPTSLFSTIAGGGRSDVTSGSRSPSSNTSAATDVNRPVHSSRNTVTGSTSTSSSTVTGGTSNRTTPGSSESRPPTGSEFPSTLYLLEVARQGPCYQCRLDKKECEGDYKTVCQRCRRVVMHCGDNRKPW